MDLTRWIRSRAASGQPLNLHAVQRERPDLLELAFAGPSPRGWRRSLIDAGVDPYKIVHEYEQDVECAVCGVSLAVLGTHLKHSHDMTGKDYLQEFGPDCEVSSESYRASHFGGRPIAGIAHWEELWSRHYVTDWMLLLHEKRIHLNVHHVTKIGRALAGTGRSLFGSWDAALWAAGLDPAQFRAIPPHREWTRSKVIEGLHNFAKLKAVNWRLRMSNPLRMAMTRCFKTPQEACRAVGLSYEEINPRAIFTGKPVARVVAAIRGLENFMGRERRQKLDAIYHNNELNRRIIVGHYGSLRELAVKEGIAPRVVAMAMYRDEADVHHDLDLLERAGKPLTYGTLRHGHVRLYAVIRETGWGAGRLTGLTGPHEKHPSCNPRSGLLRDRMIVLRRELDIGRAEAAAKACIARECWNYIERGQRQPKAATVAKIERLLEEHHIPVSTAPHTPVR